jgi:hypothetical protein
MADTFPVDYTSDVGRVRKYIPDIKLLDDPKVPTADPSFMWEDDTIQSFIDDEIPYLWVMPDQAPRYAIKRAAANIMIATANDENLILKKIITEDLQTDGPSVAKALILAAEKLRKAADEDAWLLDNEEVFFSVDYVPYPPRYDWR